MMQKESERRRNLKVDRKIHDSLLYAQVHLLCINVHHHIIRRMVGGVRKLILLHQKTLIHYMQVRYHRSQNERFIRSYNSTRFYNRRRVDTENDKVTVVRWYNDAAVILVQEMVVARPVSFLQIYNTIPIQTRHIFNRQPNRFFWT